MSAKDDKADGHHDKAHAPAPTAAARIPAQPTNKVREKPGEEPKPKESADDGRKPAVVGISLGGDPADMPRLHALRKEGRLWRVKHPGGETHLIDAQTAEEAIECYVAAYGPERDDKGKVKTEKLDEAGKVGAAVAAALGQTKVEITAEGCSAFQLPE